MLGTPSTLSDLWDMAVSSEVDYPGFCDTHSTMEGKGHYLKSIQHAVTRIVRLAIKSAWHKYCTLFIRCLDDRVCIHFWDELGLHSQHGCYPQSEQEWERGGVMLVSQLLLFQVPSLPCLTSSCWWGSGIPQTLHWTSWPHTVVLATLRCL